MSDLDGATVSTVFIGIDGDSHDGHVEGWPDRTAAIAGHRRTVDQLTAGRS